MNVLSHTRRQRPVGHGGCGSVVLGDTQQLDASDLLRTRRKAWGGESEAEACPDVAIRTRRHRHLEVATMTW